MPSRGPRGGRAARSLSTYQRKRDFTSTSEPRGRLGTSRGMRFVVHEHWATRHHWDLRLEMGGVLASWAVPREPSLDPAVRRLAVEVEDHPVDYIGFHGRIPAGSYGAGEVEIWDEGLYALAEGDDPVRAHARGRLVVVMAGRRMRGGFTLVRMAQRERGKTNWLLIKNHDEYAVPGTVPSRRGRKVATAAD